MKKVLTTEFKVGLTVIISILILILGIIWGKEYRFVTDKYRITVLFEKVGGMVPGDPVTVNGVKEGKILKIDWHERQVLCTLEINNSVQLYDDAEFSVISAELLAGMKVEIFPGKSDKKINLSKQPFKGKYGGRIVDVGLVIGALSEDMSALTYRIDTTVSMVNDLLKKGNLQSDLKNALSNFNDISGQLKDMFDTSSGKFKNAVVNFENLTEKINDFVNNNEQAVGSTVNNLNLISGRLDTISASMQMLLKNVENKQGTLGKMVYDSTLYNNLSKTLSSIDSLAKAIKQDGLDIDLF
jgi:phospholipid/cholesterol/gamma-HCH transport system substrate-binding protein